MTVYRHIVPVGIGIVLALAVAARAQTTAPSGAPPEGPQPHLELSSTKFDFGEVWETTPVRREFTVTNTGQAELTLSVRTSCGCTVATNPKSPLAPRESSAFTITFDTKKPIDANKKVTLTTNDPSQPTVDIAVTGKVKALFALSPTDRITMQGLEPGSRERAVLKLENQYGRPLSLRLKANQDFGRFDIELKTVRPGMEYELDAVTKPPLGIGWNQAEVALETGAPEVPVLTIPVAANAQPRVVAFPPMFNITPAHTQPVQKVISIDYRKDMPIHIKSVKPSLAAIQFELLPDEPPAAERAVASHKLRLTVPPFAELPAGGATVVVVTDDQDPMYQQLEIRIIKQAETQRPRRILPPDAAPSPPKPAEAGGAQR